LTKRAVEATIGLELRPAAVAGARSMPEEATFMRVWTKPEVTDIRIECDENILAACWSASAPEPFQQACQFPETCPEVEVL